MEEQNNYSIFPEQPSLVYASFWWRFAAAFIDGLILLIPSYLFPYLLNGDNEYGIGNLVSILISWLYFALQESGVNQATVGKKAMGIKVINEDGNRISFGQATGRYFGKFLSMILLFIGYLMMIWDSRKQTLHDKMAGTFVVIK